MTVEEQVTARETESITPREAAVLLMTIIRNEGGTFKLINGGKNFNCDLDTVRDFKAKTR